MKNKRGITLISLVITIVILIILSSVGIYFALGNNGILNKAKEAKNETLKQAATEKMNLKITNIQIDTYGQEQRMPTLQEFSDGLCEDDEIQYVELQSKKVGSLEKINVGNASSIFTKLKEYPYEFEINSSLQLASIDGVKIATVPTNDEDTICSMTKSELEDLIQKKISKLEIELNTLKSNYQSMVNSSLVVFDVNNVIQSETTATANTEITYTATQNCAICYGYYFKLSDGGTGICKVDDVTIAPVYTSAGSGYFSSKGIIYMKAGSVFKMKSIRYDGSYTVYGLK